MSTKRTQHTISGVFVFLLLGIFAVFATVMVLFGARAYRATAERAGMHNNARITSAYLRSMIRSDDAAGAIRLENQDGIDCIALYQDYDGEMYVTRLYVYDGMLCELFTAEDEAFDPEMGETVCEAEEMKAEIGQGLLTVDVKTNGAWNTVRCAVYAANP